MDSLGCHQSTHYSSSFQLSQSTHHQAGALSIVKKFEPDLLRSELYLGAIHAEIDARGSGVTLLDIGCGRGLARNQQPIANIASRVTTLWGVEPDEAVEVSPCIQRVWRSTLEGADIPDASVDIAISYFVLEHVEDPNSFCQSLHRILKPGGVFIAATVSGKCLFARAANALRALRLDEWMLRLAHGASKTEDYHYPTTYRLNRKRDFESLVQNEGWKSIELTFLENKEWYYYFPRGFRWCGSVYSQLFRGVTEYYSYLFVTMRK